MTTEQRTDLEGLRQQADDSTEEQILAEIQVTRREMGGTIDEIGRRLDPQFIVDQAGEQLREATVGRVERIVQDAGETAQQTSNTIIETIRENPVPATLAAIGIGWLAMRLRDNASHMGNGGAARGGRPARGWYAHDSAMGQGRYGVRETVGPPTAPDGFAAGERGEAGENAGVGDRLSERGNELGAQARQVGDDVSAQAQETWDKVQWRAQEQAEQVQRQFDRTLDENPLALGALAVGVGAAVGLAVPETQQERELMGEQRDQLMGEAQRAATEALEEVERGTEEAGTEMRQEAKTRS
jgi:hypothetical protein